MYRDDIFQIYSTEIIDEQIPAIVMDINMIIHRHTKLFIKIQFSEHLKQILMDSLDYRVLMISLKGAFHQVCFDDYQLITIENNKIKLI